MASTYLIRSTPSETFSKLTVSCWFKGMADGTQRNFWGLYDNSDNTRFFGLYYSSNGSLYAYWKQGGEGVQFTLGTMQKFRDPSAWYHFVMTMDTTLATASDRVKFYVNGERVTSFEDSLDTITQSKTCNMMNGTTDGRMQWGGGKISGTQYYWNGLMSHCHMCVGYAYDASSFGSVDSVTGEWKINTSPSVSYGTNGGFWLKDGSQLTDSSSNSNTLTVGGGTLTNTEDCPSNVFATWNVIMNNAEDGNWSNGNTTIAPNGDGTYLYAPTTIGVSSGKWYSEHMITGGNGYGMLGAISEDNIVDGFRQQTGLGTLSNSFGFRCRDGAIRMASSNTTYGSAPGTSSAILGMALDMDNKKVWYHVNGTYVTYGGGVGNPGAGTYGFDFSSLTGSTFLITCGDDTSSGYGNFKSNFGNGFFGTTAISSEGTNASGIGKFEYDVPTGFTALSTKGLNE